MTKAGKLNEQLRALSVEELKDSYLNLSKELFQVRNELAVAHAIDKPHKIKMIKRNRARVLTVLREKGEVIR